MNKTKKPTLPSGRGSLGEFSNAAVGNLRSGPGASFSVKVHRGIALVVIASVSIWGGLFWLLRLLED
jgi:hypothetical protein